MFRLFRRGRRLEASPHGRKNSTAATIAVSTALIFSLLSGAALAALPLGLSMPVSMMAIAALLAAIASFSPAIKKPPETLLFWMFSFAIVLYFVWPRNIFLPIPGLPIKHPQRLLYLSLIGLAVIVALKSNTMRERFMQRIRCYPLLISLYLLLWLWEFASIPRSNQVPGSLFLFGLDTLYVFAVLPMALFCLRNEDDLERLLVLLLAVTCIVCGISILEVATKKNPFTGLLTIGSIDPGIARQIAIEKIRGGSFRAQSSFDHPLLFAEFLTVMLPFGMMLAIYGKKMRRAIGWISTILIAVGLFNTQTRSAAANSLIGLSALWIILMIRWRKAVASSLWPMIASLFAIPVAATVLLVATGTIQSLVAGRSSEEAVSSGARFVMLDQGFSLAALRPLLGYGLGQASLVLNFKTPDGIRTLDSYLLVVLLDSGFPALLWFVATILVSIMIAARESVRLGNIRTQWWMPAIAAALVSFLATKVVLGTPLNNLLLPILMAILIISSEHAKRNRLYE